MNEPATCTSQLKEENLLDEQVQSVLEDFKRFRSYLERIKRDYKRLKPYVEWLRSGKPVPPPPIIKQTAIKVYAEKFGPRIFIETGTYTGETVDAVKDVFDKIYSIELGSALYEKAKERFAKYSHISIVFGNSAKVMPAILGRINEPCLFWLDAHYSGGITVKGENEPPVREELENILSHSVKDHVILMDDARGLCLPELRSLVLNRRPDFVFEVKNDIVRVHRTQVSLNIDI
jgi:hypothetical protein